MRNFFPLATAPNHRRKIKNPASSAGRNHPHLSGSTRCSTSFYPVLVKNPTIGSTSRLRFSRAGRLLDPTVMPLGGPRLSTALGPSVIIPAFLSSSSPLNNYFSSGLCAPVQILARARTYLNGMSGPAIAASLQPCRRRPSNPYPRLRAAVRVSAPTPSSSHRSLSVPQPSLRGHCTRLLAHSPVPGTTRGMEACSSPRSESSTIFLSSRDTHCSERIPKVDFGEGVHPPTSSQSIGLSLGGATCSSRNFLEGWALLWQLPAL